MTEILTIEELVAEVPGLSALRIERYVAAGIVQPVLAEGEAESFRPVDRARLQLACELADSFDLEDDALALVFDLIDRMHRHRADLKALMQAVAAQPEEIRLRIGAALEEIRNRG